MNSARYALLLDSCLGGNSVKGRSSLNIYQDTPHKGTWHRAPCHFFRFFLDGMLELAVFPNILIV